MLIAAFSVVALIVVVSIPPMLYLQESETEDLAIPAVILGLAGCVGFWGGMAGLVILALKIAHS